jgi:hypothetical protein
VAYINRGDPFVSLFQRPRADPIEEEQRDNGYGRGTRFPARPRAHVRHDETFSPPCYWM